MKLLYRTHTIWAITKKQGVGAKRYRKYVALVQDYVLALKTVGCYRELNNFGKGVT